MNRSVALVELERACSMLHKMAAFGKAEEIVNIKPIKGKKIRCDFVLTVHQLLLLPIACMFSSRFLNRAARLIALM